MVQERGVWGKQVGKCSGSQSSNFQLRGDEKPPLKSEVNSAFTWYHASFNKQ
ncbi:hypothetical protein EXN66_Car015529 [Channa argus]|uniref:Uncharacterized protein n=1 Tax=Channa argus TaxID=215402 RepID=A0A6G1QBC4_CHAAH|nr:hypothetical protein EXN66_Car015529 [Channa argus]